jgi:hypothetical protein
MSHQPPWGRIEIDADPVTAQPAPWLVDFPERTQIPECRVLI